MLLLLLRVAAVAVPHALCSPRALRAGLLALLEAVPPPRLLHWLGAEPARCCRSSLQVLVLKALG